MLTRITTKERVTTVTKTTNHSRGKKFISRIMRTYKAKPANLEYLTHLRATDPAEYSRVKERIRVQREHDRGDWSHIGDPDSSTWVRVKHGLAEES